MLEAVEIRQELTRKRPDTHQPDPADSPHNVQLANLYQRILSPGSTATADPGSLEPGHAPTDPSNAAWSPRRGRRSGRRW
ncbi:hypothetical protein ACFWD7_55245 [Streptomyces mirabilis]|uniref:hypothetical protein n=1 Tax=Streptomyces mirabilis TaxID=68239 RepID=UPI0021BFD9BE|nr:hypothetical protein [Streptomyces mirabilis]MCT9114396.1 hypothetical protein [Streptomyces mirabilis]